MGRAKPFVPNDSGYGKSAHHFVPPFVDMHLSDGLLVDCLMALSAMGMNRRLAEEVGADRMATSRSKSSFGLDVLGISRYVEVGLVSI